MVLVAVGLVYLVLFAICIVSISRHRSQLFQPVWLSGWLLAFSLTGIHAVYWSNMRMRAPLTPFLALLVAAGLTLIFSREDELEPLDRR